MRQRNDTGYAQHVMAWPTDDDLDREPFVVSPGETVDFPEPLGGFTQVDNAPPPAKPARKSTAALSATPEGGEPA